MFHALLMLLVQAVPPPIVAPPELGQWYIAVIGALGAATFGVVKYLSAKVSAFSDVVKMVLGLLAGFGWTYVLKFANAHGLPLPDSLATFVSDAGWVTALLNGIASMGIRAGFKATFPTASAAIKS